MKRLFLLFLLFTSLRVSAQAPYSISSSRVNTISTAVPFLRIAPDSRSGSMGDVGVALPDDLFSIYHNPSKIAFAKKKWGAGLAYTPWLKELVNDIFLADATLFWKPDSMQAITADFRLFNLSKITYTDPKGQPIGTYHPIEFVTDIAYACKLHRNFSLGISLGYVNSNLSSGQVAGGVPIKAGTAFMGGFSMFYSHPIKTKSAFRRYNIGLCVSNLGQKISYTPNKENADFLPTNLGLGTSFEFNIQKVHHITYTLELNKLLVPSPDSLGNFRTLSPLQGALQSFYDAPGGLQEELEEIMIGTGVEYNFNNIVFGRCGYFYENKYKGNRKYLTMGAGGRYKFVGLDVSYLVPTSGQKNPLDNTVRFTLYFLIK